MLYINPLTVLLIIFFTVNGSLIWFLICYGCMIAHEAAHFAAAIAIGLTPDKISLQPYGVALTLKNKIVYSYTDEVILYLSGPFMNILLALTAMIFFRRSAYVDYFYACNILLFFMNILPAEPLDGGVLLKKTLMRFLGIHVARTIMRITSAAFGVAFLTIGIWVVVNTRFNVSVLLMAGLLLINTFTQDEKYSVDLLREFIFYKDKKKKDLHRKTRMLAVNEECNMYKVAESFRSSSYSLVFFMKDNKVYDIKSESQIIEELLSSEQ